MLQEDPYKLVVLGRDYRPNLTTGANFLVNDGKIAFIMNDPAGVLRLFEYDPTSTSSALSIASKLMLIRLLQISPRSRDRS